ncbi:MAG: CoA-binding protein [Rhodocyclaceae bacterium]|jgi:predicted CoA-binding protein|nr:CoA-binding protein [Rhodocyclaceae bacterium]
MFANPSQDELRAWIKEARTIAVVGLSANPERPSHEVAAGLQSHGYRIIPVSPMVTEVLGEPAYPRLEDVPGPVDIVDVFRAPEQIGPVVDACIARGFRRLWLQQGVINEAQAQRAREAGIQVVMDRCLWMDFLRLAG